MTKTAKYTVSILVVAIAVSVAIFTPSCSLWTQEAKNEVAVTVIGATVSSRLTEAPDKLEAYQKASLVLTEMLDSGDYTSATIEKRLTEELSKVFSPAVTNAVVTTISATISRMAGDVSDPEKLKNAVTIMRDGINEGIEMYQKG